MMTFLIVFAILSFISSVFVVAAGMLSSRTNREEQMVEVFVTEDSYAPGQQPSIK